MLLRVNLKSKPVCFTLLEPTTEDMEYLEEAGHGTRFEVGSLTVAKLGTIEPIYREGETGIKEGSDTDKMAFIRGCVKKYKGKADESLVLAYIEEMVK